MNRLERHWHDLPYKLPRIRTRIANAIAARWADQFEWRWAHKGAVGRIKVTRGHYGAYFSFPEIVDCYEDVCMADLYYRSDEGATGEQRRSWAVHVYRPPDLSDPAHTFHYYEHDMGGRDD